MTATAADLTTVVVNWNTVGLLDDCLRSIVDATPPEVVNEIVVVDNGSHDGSVAHLAARWPDVRVMASATNEGFCRANNRAIRASSAPFVLLVNTDARLAPGAVVELLRYFHADPHAGAVGPRLTYADGSFQRWTAGRLLTLRSAAVYLLMLDRLPVWRDRGLYLAHDTTQPFRAGWVSSAVMALRRSALDDVGLLDESIFVYMDDVDLCDRLARRGWVTWYAADTTAVHFMGASSVRDPAAASAAALAGMNTWFARRHGRAAVLTLRLLEIVGFATRAAAYAVQGSAGRSRTAHSRARSHLVHLRQALEPVDV